MGYLKRIRGLLMKVDFFPHTQFIRYKGETAFTTATGGCVSLVVIVIFGVLFLSAGIGTIQRSTVNTSVDMSF